MKYVLGFLIVFFIIQTTIAQPENVPVNAFVKNTTISGQWFLNYSVTPQDSSNAFALKRGYLTIKSQINDDISVRFTQDITIDKEGADAGNIEVRMKYLYTQLNLNRFKLLQNSFVQFGLVPRPWMDFEQKINLYRVQNAMFLDRYNIVSSADFGITYACLLGEKSGYEHGGNSQFSGKYGSFSVGVYNGGGYHALENNKNKTLEGRLTIRPLWTILPGLQISYSTAFGKGNHPTLDADFELHQFYVSMQTGYLTTAVQYYKGIGDFSGKLLTTELKAAKNEGYSLFAEIKHPDFNWAIIGRYDNLDYNIQHSQSHYKYWTTGLAYKYDKSKILLNYKHNQHNGIIDSLIEIMFEIVF